MKTTKLNIWDFDGTLVKTPLPEFGKPLYEKRTGVAWPYYGWWSKKESLDTDIFEMPIIEQTYKDYKKESQDPNTLNVMITGRLFKLSSDVEKILSLKKLKFDKYLYNMGGDSFGCKIKQFEDLISKLPDLEIIEIWEDRKPHYDGFLLWGNELVKNKVIKKIIVNLVEENEKIK